MTWFAPTHPVARKPHRCDACRRVIRPGERYKRGAGVEWGDAPHSWKECAHYCRQVGPARRAEVHRPRKRPSGGSPMTPAEHRAEAEGAPTCPECRRHTCHNCTGWAINETTDDITTCACEQAGHEENQ